MKFITSFFILFLIYRFSVGNIVISSDHDDGESFEYLNSIDTNDIDMTIENLAGKPSNILETLYASQSFGKSHRFYFTVGDRQNDDQLLGTVFKQTGWKTETNANLTLTYPVEGKKNDKTLTYVRLVVYQQSDKNHIHIVDGGVNNSTTISINIIAEQTKYLIYNATIYGK